jgi:hypothetical protein
MKSRWNIVSIFLSWALQSATFSYATLLGGYILSLSDGLHLLNIFKKYSKSTAKLQKRFPEVYGSAMNCVLSDTTLRANIKIVVRFIKFFLASSKRGGEKYPKCDVVLFNSSNKTSFGPAIMGLSQRLVNQGYLCTVLSYDSITLFKPGGSSSSYPLTAFYRSSSFMGAVYIALREILVLMRIFIALKGDKIALPHILIRILPWWFELIGSYSRSIAASDFLKSSGARLVITHIEKIPVANELVMAANKLDIATILFLCEHPDILTQPVLSREVWVWNKTIAHSLSKEIIDFSGFSDKKIDVVGHYESDYILGMSRLSSEDLFFSSNLTPEKKIFVFISEYVENKTWKRGPITRICVEWLRIAAKNYPDWLFVFKSRPYQSNKFVPGFDYLDSAPPANLILYQGKMGLSDFLASERVTAAGALGSLGLFAAALSGIPSFRFVVSEPNMPMAFLDEFTVTLKNSSELVNALKEIEIHQSELNVKLLDIPYRGNSLRRMEALALEHLR